MGGQGGVKHNVKMTLFSAKIVWTSLRYNIYGYSTPDRRQQCAERWGTIDTRVGHFALVQNVRGGGGGSLY